MKAGFTALLIAGSVFGQLPPVPPYETKWFPQVFDHFNFQIEGTWQQRYLFSDKFWGTVASTNDCKGPIFFYTGNESPVDSYYSASGFFTQVLAPKFGALLVFAEHRYFGESLPFGNDSFAPGNIDQALADYATLIGALKAELGAENCPVVAFGGSYGGMLTAWFRYPCCLRSRAKYPNIVIGGLAASAPFGFVGTGVPPEAFTLACTATFEDAQTGCGAAVTEFWQTFQEATQSQAGLAEISTQMGLCAPLQSASDAENLLGWVLGGLQDMAMLDYPYATNYGIPVVAWPVNATCKRLLGSIKEDGVLAAMAYAIGTFYNATGQYSCYNITSDNPVWGTGDGWPYLACTSVYMPSASAGMFPPAAWNETSDAQACAEQFSVDLQPLWPLIHWGGFSSFVSGVASNIIFSNGLLDPWHTSGVLESPSEADGLIAIVIPESAHHLDLRAPNPADPAYVTAARAQEEAVIGQWLADYYQNH